MEPMDDTFDLGPMITTKLVWDMVEHDYVQQFLPECGLTPPSDEGAESAHIESHVRRLAVTPPAAVFNKLAELAADIYTTWKIGRPEDESPLPPEARGEFTEQNTELLQTAGVAIIAQLIEMKILAYGSELIRVIRDGA